MHSHKRDSTPAPRSGSTPQHGPAHPRDALQRRYGNRRVQQIIQAKSQAARVDDLENTRARSDTGGRTTGGGRPLPEGIRSSMEQTLGRDLSSVRVHEDRSALAMNAMAFTRGNHIHFAPGYYRPWSRQGQDTLRHELVHVAQQAEGRVPATRRLRGALLNDDPRLEREADDRARQAAQPTVRPERLAPIPLSTGEGAPIQRSVLSGHKQVADDVEEALSRAGIPYVIDGSYAIAIRSGYDPEDEKVVPVRVPDDLDVLFPGRQALEAGKEAMLKLRRHSFLPDDSRSELDEDDQKVSLIHRGTKISVDMVTRKRSEFQKFPQNVSMAPLEMLLAGALNRMDQPGKRDISLIADMIEKNRLRPNFIQKILPFVRDSPPTSSPRKVRERWGLFF